MNKNQDGQTDIKLSNSRLLLSVVVPAFNEEEVLPEFHNRISGVLESISMDAEIVYVNDGSTDATLDILEDLRKKDDRLAIISLSRNFGKEVAMSAGLDHAKGNAVIVIDADLQDPPELIPQLLQHWMDGYDVVYAKRISRSGENFLKKTTAYSFYRIIQRVSRIKIPEDTGDFRLLSRRAVDSLKKLPEHHRFMKGLFAWIGYSQKAVPYHRDPRYAGQTNWNYWRLWNLAVEGITSFSIAPIKISTYFGLFVALCTFMYAIFVFFKALFYGDPVRGYPSLMLAILFLGGIQLIAIGMIGEYIGRIFNETKRRPLYLIQNYIPSHFENDKPS